MFELNADLPAELVPLSWLIGVWEGTGVMAYRVGDEVREREFGQRIAFTPEGGTHLQYSCASWLLPEDGDDEAAAHPRHLFSELGYWRLSRSLGDGDNGPGMLPRTADEPYTTTEQVESLRNAAGAFDIEVHLVQPGGVSELYLGQINGPRIDVATDAVLRSATAKEYSAATRMYGLVEEHLLWAWDIAALGQDLRTHASARLGRAQ